MARTAAQPLAREEADVLFQIAEGFGGAGFFKGEPGGAVVRSLLRQGLVERKRGAFFVSADVAFSLALDD